MPRSKPFLLVLREALTSKQKLPPITHTFPLASSAGSHRGSFGEARGHTETSPCLPHPHCGKKWCSAGWRNRMPLPSLLLSPWELSGPQRPENTFFFSWAGLCSVGGKVEVEGAAAGAGGAEGTATMESGRDRNRAGRELQREGEVRG